IPYDTASAIGASGVASGKAEWCLAVPAPYDDAVGILLNLFHKVATPDVHAQLQCTLLDEPFGRRLRQEQRERKARFQCREIKQRIQPSEEKPRVRPTLWGEAFRDPTQGEYLQGSTVERQCAGLGDAFGAPFQHEDFHFCQRQLTRKPQSHRSAANDDDVKFIAHDHLTTYLTMLDII